MVMDGRGRLTELDRTIIGKSKRVIVPLHNKMLLRDVADALRGLAQVMDIHSRLDTMSERDALLRVKVEIDHTNQIIRSACKRYDVKLRDGRPTDKERLGNIAPSGESNGSDWSQEPQGLDDRRSRH